MLYPFTTFIVSHAVPGTTVRTRVAALGMALATAGSMATAQTAAPDAQCILAGRVDGSQRWAPQARGVELLDAQGKRIRAADKAALANVKQARITSPALLSTCNGDQALAKGDDLPNTQKTSSPAVSAGATPVSVEAVSFPPLRVGGTLVELRLNPAPDRIVSLTR